MSETSHQTEPKSAQPQRIAALLSAPSRVGIVAQATQFFSDKGWDVVRFDQRSVNGRFCARVEWEHQHRLLDSTHITTELAALETAIQGQVEVQFLSRKQSIALMVDRPCDLLMDIANACGKAELASLELVFIASKDVDTEVIANRFGIPFFTLPKNDVALETRILELVKRYKPSLLGVAQSEHIFSAQLQRQIIPKVIGVRSAFVPAHMGHPRLQFDSPWAVKAGAGLTVASSFFYSPEIGSEAIILQDSQTLAIGDDESSVDVKRQLLESRLFLATLANLVRKRVLQLDQRCVVF